MIPHEYIEEVVRRNDIVDVIGTYVQLRHRGRTHNGLCPFHNEKTPSFTVYPDNQSFYCFGCQEGGDVITFTKKINNLDYVEAIKMLASRAGMPLPEEDDQTGRLRSRVLSINKDAARFFHEQLNAETAEAKTARRYWRGRGLSDSTIRRFGLGYAPDGFQNLRTVLRSKGYTEDEMVASGLIKRNDKGNVYDLFRGRVMTPIFDLRGNVIAFGGRVLGDEKPKYINSPETLVYKKSKTMYAMNIAKKSTSRRYILCEGYMDVISLQQAGFDTAVAACGTALTAEQVRMLADYADEVVLCYDTDEAGQKATARSLGLFAQSPLKVSVLRVTGAKDPDEFIKKFGRERFDALLTGSSNALEYKLALAKQKYDLKLPAQRVEYVKDAVKILAADANPTEQEVYCGRIAEETDISKAAILNQLSTAVKAKAKQNARQKSRSLLSEGTVADIKLPYNSAGNGQQALASANAEQQLVVAMLKNNALIPLVQKGITPDEFIMNDMAEAYRAILKCHQNGAVADMAAVATEASDAVRNRIARLLAYHHDLTIQEKDVQICIDRIQKSRWQSGAAGDLSDDDWANAMNQIKNAKK